MSYNNKSMERFFILGKIERKKLIDVSCLISSDEDSS